MVDKSAFVLSLLITVPEAKTAVVEEAGIPVLVEIIEVGSQRQKEIAVSILLQICEDNLVFRAMVAREGAIPALVALTQSGTNRAKQKVSLILNFRLFKTSCLLLLLQLTWHACFGNQCRFVGYLFEGSTSLVCHVSYFFNFTLLFRK
jgi:hypothetical protein